MQTGLLIPKMGIKSPVCMQTGYKLYFCKKCIFHLVVSLCVFRGVFRIVFIYAWLKKHPDKSSSQGHPQHHPPSTMAPKGSKANAAAVEATAAKAETKAAAAAAKAAAAEEKKAEAALAKAATAEEAALKKAAARVGTTKRGSWYAPDGPHEEISKKLRITIPAYAPQMGPTIPDTQVDGGSDTQQDGDQAPLSDLFKEVMDDDEPLQASATLSDDTAGEDGQQASESPEQQSPETPTQSPETPSHEACPPIPTTPHQPPDLVCSIVNQSLILSL